MTQLFHNFYNMLRTLVQSTMCTKKIKKYKTPNTLDIVLANHNFLTTKLKVEFNKPSCTLQGNNIWSRLPSNTPFKVDLVINKYNTINIHVKSPNISALQNLQDRSDQEQTQEEMCDKDYTIQDENKNIDET